MRIRTLTLGIGISLAAISSASAADAPWTLAKHWSDGPPAVDQFSDGRGPEFCHFQMVSGNKVFAISETVSRPTLVLVSLGNDTRWTHGGTIFMSIDGRLFNGQAIASNDGSALNLPIALGNQGGSEFLHALYNGSQVTVNAGPLFKASFSLAGSAAAITVMHECAATAYAQAAAPRDTAPDYNSSAPATAPKTYGEAAVTQQSSGFFVNATINSSQSVTLQIDSGAGDVVIPRTIADHMLAEGSLQPADYRGTRNYVLADGRTVTDSLYLLHSLTVGGITVHDVECAVTDSKTFLLGQTFLGKLSSWSIDNRRGVLKMDL